MRLESFSTAAREPGPPSPLVVPDRFSRFRIGALRSALAFSALAPSDVITGLVPVIPAQ